MVRTRSKPYGLCRRLCIKAHIKGFGSPILHIYTCLLLCFMLVLASLVLGLATFDAFLGLDLVWLHLMPMRHCSDVTIWEASPDAGLLLVCPSLFRSVRWYACHACLCHPLALYAFLHACLYVHAWALLVSVLSILWHNEAMDTRSKPTFVSCGHHLLFAILLVCLLASWFLCLPLLLHLFASCLFIHTSHLSPSIACLQVSCPCLCMYAHGSRMHRARARFLRCKQKGHKWEHANMSQTTVVSRFRV